MLQVGDKIRTDRYYKGHLTDDKIIGIPVEILEINRQEEVEIEGKKYIRYSCFVQRLPTPDGHKWQPCWWPVYEEVK